MDCKKIHMIGIGGCSMSGIAEIAKTKGIEVTGSDMEETYYVKKLLNKGFKISIGHDANNIDSSIDLIVYSTAISMDNPEIVRAKELGIPLMERGEFLGYITKQYKNTICIAGTHGKSTTSGMVAKSFIAAGADPTIQIGATLYEIGGNNKVGTDDNLILESCEYHESYLYFHPKIALVLNVDADHLEYFGSLDNVKASFKRFINLVPEDGYVIINKDDVNSNNIYDDVKGKVVTFAINNNADFKAIDLSYDEDGHPSYKVLYKDNILASVVLNVIGEHNVYDSLATIVICYLCNLNMNKVVDTLKEYSGVHRRFEFLGLTKSKALVYDDYAHHPAEIETTLYSVNQVKHHKTWALHQPFTYTRTKDHLDEFAEVLSRFDNIVLTDIYAGREKDIYNIKSEDLVEKIKPLNPSVYHFSDVDELVSFLNEHLEENDIICSIGCGPVDKISQKLIDKPKCGC